MHAASKDEILSSWRTALLVTVAAHAAWRAAGSCHPAATGPIANGKPGQCTSGLPNGGCCVPSCDDGYELRGNRCCGGCGSHPIDGCLTDTAHCDPKPCTGANGAAGGPHGRGAGKGSTKCPPVLQNGKSCEPGCEPGYQVHSPRVCHRGVLSGATKCDPVSCGVPPTPAHTTTSTCSTTALHFGDGGCSVTCLKGWTGGKTTATFTCGADKTLSNRDFSCTGACRSDHH